MEQQALLLFYRLLGGFTIHFNYTNTSMYGISDLHEIPLGFSVYQIDGATALNTPPGISLSAQGRLIGIRTTANYGVIFYQTRNTDTWYMQNLESGTWREWKHITFT